MPIQLMPSVTTLPTIQAESIRLSRRDFLKGAAIAGVGAFAGAGCKGRAGSNGNEAGWHAWSADLHVAADPKATLRDEFMAENLRKVVREVLDADDAPRGFFVNGDLAYHEG